MTLVSVNVGLPRAIEHNGTTIETGIFKQPVSGRIRFSKSGLAGDGQADKKNHGGIDKAAYAYSFENYEYWKKELGRDHLDCGQFGENFTYEGYQDNEVCLGDVFQIGDAVAEVTQPRVPCFKLGIRMQLPKFPKLFLASCRLGFYLRVLDEGEVGAGDEFRCLWEDPARISVWEACYLVYFDPSNSKRVERALKIKALSDGWRNAFQQVLGDTPQKLPYSDSPTARKSCAP